MSTDSYEQYDYDNYQAKYCNQPVQIRRLLYGLIGDTKSDVLTIGCGNGYIEEPLVKKGHNVFGFELTEKACALSRAKGIQCESTDFLTLDMDQYTRRFDWIIAIDLWEHVIESDLFLSQISRLLKDGGRFFLKSPNFGHIKFRYRYLKQGTLGTEYQLEIGHYAHYNYRETIQKIKTSPLRIDGRYCFTYNPVPFVFKYRNFLFPNLTSLSIILVLSKEGG
jgi:2-polyprenyl-3-methyl-5-hydroxy-6-metoxy-1,4-benzoquinol methylase